MQRIPDVKEAEEIKLELDDVFWTTTPSKRRYLKEFENPREPKEFENLLVTLARRLKFEFLLWRVYGENDTDVAPREIFRFKGTAIPSLPFRVINIKPSPEAQITPNTKVVVNLSPDS